MKGLFITIEGVEGCGKTTQIARLKKRIESRGYRVVVTREPGGTPVAEAIRRVILDPAHTAMSGITELLLYEAARAQHVDELIRSALYSGTIVLSDRFADSTTAYQGAGRAISTEIVQILHQIATRGTWPDLTIVIDLPVGEGLARAARAHTKDRIELEPIEFHERVRKEFLVLAEREPDRVKVVDGSKPVEAVAEDIGRIVDEFLGDSPLDKR